MPYNGAMQIDIIADTICPWCYIGKRRLEQALALRPDTEAVARWRPFLLNPEMPADGIDRTAHLVKKFGSESRMRRVFGAIAEAGQSVEIDFSFESIRRTPSSVNSHRLVRFAEGAGKADACMEALFLAYFINGHDIGETEVLVTIGANLGLDMDAFTAQLESDTDVDYVYEENARAHRLGINGVPSFVFDGHFVTSGAQEAPVLARMIDAAQAAADDDA
jgi:predicted DsbA family dithiol-disulfide isomerase